MKICFRQKHHNVLVPDGVPFPDSSFLVLGHYLFQRDTLPLHPPSTYADHHLSQALPPRPNLPCCAAEYVFYLLRIFPASKQYYMKVNKKNRNWRYIDLCTDLDFYIVLFNFCIISFNKP